jgi:hypothetical protein
MAQAMSGKFTTPVADNRSFSLFKSDSTREQGADSMNPNTSSTSKPSGASAKAARQAKLAIAQPTSEPVTQVTEPTEQAPETATCPRCEATVDINGLGETGWCTTCEEETLAERSELPVADLLAARRQLDKQIKAAKANQPAKPEKAAKQPKTLADVVAAQLARPRTDLPRILTTYILQRQAAGQDLYQALDEVLAQMKSIVLGSLDSKQSGETYHQAIFRYLGRTDMMDTAADTASNDSSDEQQ